MDQQKPPVANPKSNDGVRETIEMIVVVAILVLLLKTFVAEAFVIPTGSMAVTLLGAQKMTQCPQCGYEFPVNCSSERESPPDREPDVVIGCTCPNCRYHIDFRHERASPSCASGDRLVVGKSLYDLHLDRVERQDVVVFKYPKTPQAHFEAINYIKRLIGKPGETVAIHQGDLYVYPGSATTPALAYPERPRPARREDLWQREYMYENDPEATALFRQGKFQIVRKAPDKVLALRRLVYDNDHAAKDLVESKFPARWAPEGNRQAPTITAGEQPSDFVRGRQQAEEEPAWVSDKAHGFRHAMPEGHVDWLRYRHLVRERGPERERVDLNPSEIKPQLITDFMGYDSWRSLSSMHSSPPPNWVGDLILECEVQVESSAGQASEGQIILELSKGVDRFQARWELPSGQCKLVRLTGSREEELASMPSALKPGRSHLLRFGNVDERLMVWVDRRLPFGQGVDYTPPPQSGPFANDLQPASIGARSLALQVRKLRLWRDTYYTLKPGDGDAPLAADEWSEPDRWQALRQLPVETFYVQPGHYLCLGDNSPESADSRSWGLVPDRLLLGRALLVYFPFRRVGPIE
jgi:signal peptidase I